MRLVFSGFMLQYVDYRRTVDLDAATLGHAMAELARLHPRAAELMLDAAGGIRRTHQLFLNDLRLPDPSPDQPLAAGDRVEVLTAVAGG
ncbi:MoaD/ThiS family protein [Streptomyces sp. NPDC048659]|uniref:MoaD/ThiS family protein n=1 Tax=Streptomyces sp. NPDC048659 TaxID=3155489 RepID=UPI0034275F66